MLVNTCLPVQHSKARDHSEAMSAGIPIFHNCLTTPNTLHENARCCTVQDWNIVRGSVCQRCSISVRCLSAISIVATEERIEQEMLAENLLPAQQSSGSLKINIRGQPSFSGIV